MLVVASTVSFLLALSRGGSSSELPGHIGQSFSRLFWALPASL